MRTFSVFIFTFIILSSCHTGVYEREEEVLNADEGKQVLFFSDESNLHKEGNYYEALLELKASFPNEITNMKVITLSESNKYDEYAVTTFPSLLVVNGERVIEQIEGNVRKEDIIKPIEKALSN